ncbi:MAG: hypothetical protein KIT60_30110 [Burkholderiaceae bacterium]|nr:hypothetical protein [Burkholderiaceae bacterium]
MKEVQADVMFGRARHPSVGIATTIGVESRVSSMADRAPSKSLTRRAVLAAGTFAVMGCSGGGDGVDVPESGAGDSTSGSGGGGTGGGTGGGNGGGGDDNGSPVWSTVPTVTFTVGVPAVFSIAAFVTEPDGDPLTITHSGSLPNGVTFDAANKRFVYDGSGVAQSTGGHVLTADDLQ